jgi:predicted TIM-barrel fold metal-dependent hydrolase
MGQVIDADGHVLETDAELYDYLEPPFSGDPAILKFPFFPTLDGFQRVARRLATGTRKLRPDATEVTVTEWIDFLDRAGIEMAVVYPTHGLGFGLITDPEWACGLATAYNNWLADRYLKVTPRIRGMALIPLQAPAEAVKELRRAVTEFGMVGAILPAVGLRRPFGDSYYDPVYAEAERLGCMLAVHGAPAQGLGFDFFDRLVEARALSHPFSQMIQITSIMMNGVLERFPRLRLSFMEAGSGWIPFMMERLDGEFKNRGAGLKIPPSEQFRSERVFFHCELGEGMLHVAIQAVGDSHFFCASDFPHEPAHEFPEAIEAFLKRPDLDAAAKAKILYDNPRRLYAL